MNIIESAYVFIPSDIKERFEYIRVPMALDNDWSPNCYPKGVEFERFDIYDAQSMEECYQKLFDKIREYAQGKTGPMYVKLPPEIGQVGEHWRGVASIAIA